ncbi:MAG: SDR family oxidoreductase [Bdellovibrionia bacterium]
MKVLVTGANGFLGSWLCRALAQDGHDVFVLVRKGSDLSELDGIKCQYIYGDVTDTQSVLRATNGMETVFHLAGVIAYKKSERQLMERVNVQGTANIVDACLENGVPKLVYLSSVVAVGASFTPKQVLNENSTYNIAHLDLGYFQTKHEAELLVLKAHRERGLDVVILNPSTIYGGGDAKKGSRKTQVKVAQGKFPFYLSGGVNVVAVEDVIAGIISAWKKGRSGERYILAGENITIRELFSMIAKAAGQKEPQYLIPTWLIHLLGIVGDFLSLLGLKGGISRENAYTATMYHWFDNSKAKTELNFDPKPAQYAINNSVQWMKENGII